VALHRTDFHGYCIFRTGSPVEENGSRNDSAGSAVCTEATRGINIRGFDRLMITAVQWFDADEPHAYF
jgi:hypothetical protein